MNLLARFIMLRTAALAMVGVPDDIDVLKQMSAVLTIPALTDADAATSRLMLQALIVTHGTVKEREVPDAFVQRFLQWELPESVRADLVATDPELASGKRTGTNLLTAEQANAMLQHILYGEKGHDERG